MKEKIGALKAQVKVCAQASRAVTLKRLQLKASRTDKQSEDYRQTMESTFFERRGVRWEGRIAHLAYGFARGVPYQVMEPKTEEAFPYQSVAALLGLEDEMPLIDWVNTEVAKSEEAA